MKTIITSHEKPPIPIRKYDWSAIWSDYDEGDPIGYGSTEEEAMEDLKSLEEEIIKMGRNENNWTSSI